MSAAVQQLTHERPAFDEVERLRRRLGREREARREAEEIAERGLRTLYEQQRQAKLLERIATAANESESVSDALQFALARVCEFNGWPMGHAWLPEQSETGPCLRPGTFWCQPGHEVIADFAPLTRDMEFPAGVGLPGRILATGQPSWITDLASDGNFPRREAARCCGLKTAYGFPVLVRSEVVAVLEFFNGRTAEPDSDLLRLMSQIGLQLGRVVERQRARQKLLHDASHDALTRLPNRVLFQDRLAQAVAAWKRDADADIAVLFIDLDQFKLINDSLGHLAGDDLLVQVAARLQGVLRESDTLARSEGAVSGGDVASVDTLARLGGDEFTILLSRIRHPTDAVRVADRLQETLRAPFEVGGHGIYTSASIGIVTSASRHVTAADLLRDADLAMYRAKALGKARYEVFDQQLHLAARQRLQLETDLRRALANGEFVLHYQPIVSLQDRGLVGFEALLRWNKPGEGLVDPGAFIPIAEETGLIVFIGAWVLREACRIGRHWQESVAGAEALTMSVNISARQFQLADFVASVRQVLADTGFDPSKLRLELTESMTMGDAERAVRVLSELKRLGVKVSVDDFGTGFSSLSYLHRLPVDILKIDRSFVSDMERNEQSRHIVDTILNLARSLRMQVIAEGTESEDQIDRLTSLGCEFGQGYAFSKPLTEAAARSALEGGRL